MKSIDSLIQVYETTIWDYDGNQSGHFTVFSLTDSGTWVDQKEAEKFLKQCGVRVLRKIDPEFLAGAVDFCLAPPKDWRKISSGAGSLRKQMRKLSPSVFAQYLTYAPVLPVERSPLEAATIAKLVSRAAAWGAGPIVGVMIAGGGSPMLLVWVPLAIIVFGAARGVGKGIEEVLRTLIIEHLAIRKKQKRKKKRKK